LTALYSQKFSNPISELKKAVEVEKPSSPIEYFIHPEKFAEMLEDHIKKWKKLPSILFVEK
jgi:hypothetical protein